jgi:transposase
VVEKLSRAELCRIIERLVAENERLRAENALLRAEVERLTLRVKELETELAGRGPSPSQPPAWVKKNTPQRSNPKKPRKKRDHNFARKRGVPTRRVVHAAEVCPKCGCALKGGSVKRHREVIELVISPVEVIDHLLVERVCPQCDRAVTPSLGPEDGIVGRHRFGPRLLALISFWHEAGRMTVRAIQEQLGTLFGVHVSLGAIEDALHTVATRGATQATAIRDEIRRSEVVHGDETGWREDGQNRSVWLIATPKARYFEIGRRTNEQIDSMLGADFAGVVVCDCYSAYDHLLGEKQRCWAHLLRDVADLVAQHPDDTDLAAWAELVRRIYRRARDRPGADEAARWRTRKRLEVLLERACRAFVGTDATQRTLCQRLLKHLHELFVFVVNPAVPSTNNEAERDLRPLVIARKVWGGTRSAQGSVDAMRRATLYATWRVRGLNPFQEFYRLLLSPQV